MIWIAALIFVAMAGVFGVVYLTGAISRFEWVRKLSGEKKWLRRLISFGLIALGFGIVTLAISLVDAIVVFLHVLFFFLVYGLLFRIIKSATGKTPKIYWQGWLALLTSVVYLAVGYYQCVNVWQTDYRLSSDKLTAPLRIAMFADSHVSTTFDGDGFAAYLDEIMAQEPDILLIPGDFVDDWSKREDMLRACGALGSAKPRYGVWFVYGNHDEGFFSNRDFSAQELAQALEANGVHILEDEIAYVGELCIVGRRDAMLGDRMELSELLRDADESKYIIVLDHEPTDYEAEAATAADLVVSGHTHGGQLIPLTWIGERFGGNDRSYGHETRNGTDFIVTSGISDWAMHFKTGTRSEYVIIDIDSN